MLGDCLTATGQVNTELIPKIPRSYRVLYTRRIVDLADRAAASQGGGAALTTPPVDAWSFASVRRARARTVRIEERQDSRVWESLRGFNVLPRLYHFVLRVLWRKVPVAARMFAFGLVSTLDCTLCSQQDDHTHILKRCPYLSIPFSVIRRLWGAVINGNSWIEPSRLCLEHSSISLSSVQGWLCCAAIYARWLIRCEYISFQRVDATTALSQRWYSVIHLWGSLSQGALPASVVKTTLHGIAQFLQVRQSSAVLPVPRQQRYFRLGFFEPHQQTKRKRACQLVAAANPPSLSVCTAAIRSPGGPVAGGASFGQGSRGNFHRVFEPDISPLQGECAVLAQVLRDTP